MGSQEREGWRRTRRCLNVCIEQQILTHHGHSHPRRPQIQTTRETLERVKDLQVEIGVVQGQLSKIEKDLGFLITQVQEAKCIAANNNVVSEVKKIRDLWMEYYYGETSVLGTSISETEMFLVDSTNVDSTVQTMMTAWANKVRSDVNIFSSLITLHEALVTTAYVPGAIETCGQAFYGDWKLAKHFPVDDRRCYDRITAYLTDKIVHQTNGVRCVGSGLAVGISFLFAWARVISPQIKSVNSMYFLS